MKQIVIDIETIADEEAMAGPGRVLDDTDYPSWPLVQLACVAIFTVTNSRDGAPAFHLATHTRESKGESAIVREVERAVADAGEVVTYNGRSFDMPVLIARAAACRIAAPHITMLYPRANAGRHIDLIEVVSAYGAAPRPKLADLCAGLGIPAKRDAKPGGVARLAAEGDWSRIARYCEGDVLSTWVAHRVWSSVQAPSAPFGARAGGSDLDEHMAALAAWIRSEQPRLEHLRPYSDLRPCGGAPVRSNGDNIIF